MPVQLEGDRDLRSIQQARQLARRAAESARTLATLSQEALDAVLDAMHRAALPKAAEWARLAVEETGFGNAPDKFLKNLFSTVELYHHIRPMKTVGVLREDPDRRVMEIASPVGVVAAIIPSTNPTSTAIYKSFIAIKAGNAVVLSPHPYARKCVAAVADVLAGAAVSAGAPDGAVSCMTDPALEGTHELMRHPDVGVILATGGTGLVRAAYSSGKPAFGVGPGNVPAFVERTADVPKAARDIISGKTFDNGVLCSSENAVVADRPIAERLVECMKEQGAMFLTEDETVRLSRLVVRQDGSLNTAIVGRPAPAIAGMAGIAAPAATRCLVATLTGVGKDHPLSREKLSPILAFYVEDGWEACCLRVLEILRYGGMGHTMSIHSQDSAIIMKFAMTKPVFRICVNTPASVGAVGLTTGLEPSMTLGCGALGGNITSDNIMPRHLINLKRLAFETKTFESAKQAAGADDSTRVEVAVEAGAVAATREPERSEDGWAASTVQAGTRRGAPPNLRDRVARAVSTHRAAPAPEAPPGRQATARKETVAPTAVHPVPFVSEADVRQALLEQRRIPVGARTIITPSARDLGQEHRVFVQV
ncbi:MAG TPA: aldehyde dehydrogenase family protein [Candidatus Polarisedimenticolia bacterium]|nr:aldehyde dehydrogenase family protein [Candidatus Polarisedimenticolia bacterium]